MNRLSGITATAASSAPPVSPSGNGDRAVTNSFFGSRFDQPSLVNHRLLTPWAYGTAAERGLSKERV